MHFGFFLYIKNSIIYKKSEITYFYFMLYFKNIFKCSKIIFTFQNNNVSTNYIFKT